LFRVISKLGYAILAMLARQPSTGYELSARSRRPIGYFWSARHGQVYPELQKLLDAELVRFSAGPGPGPRAKKVYSLTEAGLAVLSDWVLQDPAAADGGRDELLLKAYAIWTADPARAERLFAGQIRRHQERLGEYEADWKLVESRHQDGPPPVTHPDFGSYATLRCGISYERHRIAWLTWMCQQLAAHHVPGAADRP
jgi:DNA-binding PadR family transcriptional regulator